jgi:hypothetical protein
MTDHRPDSTPRKWTLMVYLAGDNNLESYGQKDLAEMSRGGSSSDVAVVAQFDRMSDQQTRRYFIQSGQNLDASCVAMADEVNTGDPAALVEFITWASQTYPAERYGLVLWNHGSGWKDDDIYEVAQRQGAAQKVSRGQMRGLTSGKISRALFRSSLEYLVTDLVQHERAILYDDSSADFLDNLELRLVLENAANQIGHPLDLIGFDACLMNMLEVHYQIRNFCQVAVGSQEIEPGDGWPYDDVLARLVENPDMTSKDLGREIVEAYVRYYQSHFPSLSVTQSAVCLNGIDAVADALDNLAHSLIESLTDQAALGLIFSALRAAQRFSDRDYVDLAHFCQALTSHDESGKIGQAARLMTDVLLGGASLIIAEGHHGANVAHSHGLSIYLPTRSLSPRYQQLEFAQHHAWDEFLTAFTLPD